MCHGGRSHEFPYLHALVAESVAGSCESGPGASNPSLEVEGVGDGLALLQLIIDV